MTYDKYSKAKFLAAGHEDMTKLNTLAQMAFQDFLGEVLREKKDELVAKINEAVSGLDAAGFNFGAGEPKVSLSPDHMFLSWEDSDIDLTARIQVFISFLGDLQVRRQERS